MWPFSNSEEQKKGDRKKFGKIGKKARADGPQQKSFLVSPFFGPSTTKGCRTLLYRMHYKFIVEVLEKIMRRMEMIDHSFERKFYGACYRLS